MTFRVVVGYLPNVDYASEDAWRHGLVHRCAFVMNTDSPYSDDMVFNAPLYQALVTTVWEIVDSERADVRSLDQKVTPAARLAELETRLAEHSRVEDEPASEIIMFRGETAVAFIESQPWARFGGPNIYHDTYTVAVHTASDVSDLLVARAHDVDPVRDRAAWRDAAEHAAGQGVARPPPAPLAQRPLSPNASSNLR